MGSTRKVSNVKKNNTTHNRSAKLISQPTYNQTIPTFKYHARVEEYSVNKYFADLMFIVCEGVVWYALCMQNSSVQSHAYLNIVYNFMTISILCTKYGYICIYLKFPYNPS